MPWLSGLSAVARPRSRATSRTSGLVSSPSGNSACASCSWRRPYRKYVWSLSSSRARRSDGAAIGRVGAPGVVAGRDRVALVQVARPTEQRPELHLGVAVRAGRRGLAVEVRAEERREHAGLELALQVHHVERDAELARDPAGVLRGVERAAALLELRDGIGDVVQAHPHADDVVALLGEQRRGDGRIDAAGHRDEGAGHEAASEASAGTPFTTPRPRRAGSPRAPRPRRENSARIRGTISTAASISASVVERPSESRSEPRASSSG